MDSAHVGLSPNVVKAGDADENRGVWSDGRDDGQQTRPPSVAKGHGYGTREGILPGKV
jgi:hypothetical protein